MTDGKVQDPSDVTPENTGLSPHEYERRKTAEGRVEDYAYTINHALVCSTVDIFGAPVSKWTEDHWGFKLQLPGHEHGPHTKHAPGEKHEGHEHGHAHEHEHGHGESGKGFRHWYNTGGKNWLIGEVVGDYAAVPVTVMFQRWAPGFMNNVRWVMEPVLGPLFRHGARGAAKHWGAAHGFDADSAEVQERERQIYEHEVRHLPQALMWTASSTVLNIATQYGLERKHIHSGELSNWALRKTGAKLVGAASTAAVVVFGRALSPHGAERWDRFTSKHIFLPVTEKIGSVVGVKKEDVERMEANKERLENDVWADRIKRPGTDKSAGVDGAPGLV